MKLLTVDIETAPNIADVWGLRDQNIGLNQIRESARMICFAAKWRHEKQAIFKSEYHDGKSEMLDTAHQLVSEADGVIHYNGVSFDMKHLNREFLEAGMDPPSPVQQIDLLRVTRANFRFPSHKLDYVAGALGIGHKVKHEGHDLWSKCLAGDEAAWGRMRKYNIQDVLLTEKLYQKLLPWAKGMPNAGLFTDSETPVCPRCGSDDFQRRGLAHLNLASYPQFRCNKCAGHWRSGKAEARVDARIA